ncbi:hypothetical protein DXG01_007259 [Tephrocybe rancida]|nr:hypothetical protein DXG01_007259 [Tephrocybe rancida]
MPFPELEDAIRVSTELDTVTIVGLGISVGLPSTQTFRMDYRSRLPVHVADRLSKCLQEINAAPGPKRQTLNLRISRRFYYYTREVIPLLSDKSTGGSIYHLKLTTYGNVGFKGIVFLINEHFPNLKTITFYCTAVELAGFRKLLYALHYYIPESRTLDTISVNLDRTSMNTDWKMTGNGGALVGIIIPANRKGNQKQVRVQVADIRQTGMQQECFCYRV